MSLLRRFVFMVAKGSWRGNEHFYILRRINMSRFFYPGQVPRLLVPGIEEAPLPPTRARFCARELVNGHMDFMLLARDKVLAVEATGRTTIYDDSFRVVRSGPVLKAPLYWPISVPVDDSGVYVLDSKHCFQKLVHGNSSFEDWTCEALPAAPREVRGGSRPGRRQQHLDLQRRRRHVCMRHLAPRMGEACRVGAPFLRPRGVCLRAQALVRACKE